MFARGKGVEGEARGEVAEDTGERFDVHAVLQMGIGFFARFREGDHTDRGTNQYDTEDHCRNFLKHSSISFFILSGIEVVDKFMRIGKKLGS